MPHLAAAAAAPAAAPAAPSTAPATATAAAAAFGVPGHSRERCEPLLARSHPCDRCCKPC